MTCQAQKEFVRYSYILGIFTLTVKNSLKQYIFPERTKYGSKKANIIFSVYQGVFGHFTTIYFRFPKATQHFRRLPKTLEDQRRGPTIDCQRSLKSPPSETENIIKLANLTANTKNFYGQITLNTKPHSDPLFTCMSEKVWKQLV